MLKNVQKIETAVQKINEALKEVLGENDPDFLLDDVLAQLLLKKSSEPHSIGNTTLTATVDAYVAAKVGPLWPRLMALHQGLVHSGATVKKPFDFEHNDRFGVAFANEEKWKSMALQTKSYTYMVVLQRRDTIDLDCEGGPKDVESWGVHLRVCTKSKDSCDYARPSFKAIDFLSSYVQVYPKTGHGPGANEYFEFKDCRDRGYLCSVLPYYDPGQYMTCDTMTNYFLLSQVLFDLASHCDFVNETFYGIEVEEDGDNVEEGETA